MVKLTGEMSLNVRFEFDLEDELFEECETVWDAVNTIIDQREDLCDLCKRNKILSIFYEGLEIIDPNTRE